MADQDVKMLIERIMAEARTHQSARFSNEIYADEPILKTGRQMQNFLPDQYRKMREISRWQEDPKGGAGRWLSEAELFYRQGLLMADFEDDCPYNGTFKSYFPTYNAMSDRQLRGYFTWRAQVRRGNIEETSTSFAFLYLYELICGTKTSNDSYCYRQSPSESKPETIWKSTGRFASAPRVSDGILTISPRVHNDEGVYYGMTAIDLTDGNNTKRAQLVLPSSVSPFEAVYMGDTFVFSIEATYSGVGSLGNMGTYIGSEGGPYLFLSREPLACAAGRKNKYLVKVQASHFLIDTSAKTYGSLLSPDRALEYGDYPATAGKSNSFLTYATVRNSQGIPETVTARLFSL